MNKEELGRLLKLRRIALGLTIIHLSELTALSKTTISQIEKGKSNPTFEVLKKIMEYLNLEIKVELPGKNK